jgi:NAD kinase
VVVVTRPTEYEQLLAQHATRPQAAFFLKTRGQSLDEVAARHAAFEAVLQRLAAALPVSWRRTRVQRHDLDRFLFEPEDVVVVVGQDGLVANVAKYLHGQAVVGLNPDPARYEGVLVPHPPAAGPDLIRAAVAGRGAFEARTMVEAVLDGEPMLVALNEIFIGHRTHQSARYELTVADATERHSSSGLIVATGTGATGWARSIARERHCELPMPAPGERRCIFFVREAWPSVHTGCALTQGLLDDGAGLEVVSRMDEGVIFGDGIEADRLEFGWGRRVTLRVAARVLRLLRG